MGIVVRESIMQCLRTKTPLPACGRQAHPLCEKKMGVNLKYKKGETL
jgi:hypothetical protein